MNPQFHRMSHALRDFWGQAAMPTQSLVLVTLVHTEGSCYQKAGAQLLLTDRAQVFGVVSGGCLEQAILEEAWMLLQSGGKRLKIYETEGPDELDFGYGMGCGGKLWVFFEALADRQEILRLVRGEDPQARLTSILIEAKDLEQLGYRPQLRGADIEELSAKLAPQQLSILQASPLGTYALFRKVPELELVIFGAGPGAWPLAAYAHQLAWSVSVYDHRPALLEDFPRQWGQALLLDRAGAALAARPPAPLQAAVLMTHSFAMDRTILENLQPERWVYIGLMGSLKRVEKLWESLGANSLLRQDPGRVYGPAGVALGGTDPASIALQICAEIQAVLYQKQIVQAPPFISRGEQR